MNKPLIDLSSLVDTEKAVKRTFGVIFAIWIVWVLFILTALVGLVYAAWHFISKYW